MFSPLLSDIVQPHNAHLIRQYARENPFVHFNYKYDDDVLIDNIGGRENLWIRRSDIPFALRYNHNIEKNRALLQYGAKCNLHFKSWHDPWQARYHYIYHQYNIEFSEPVVIDPYHFTKTALHEASRLFRRKCINYMRRMVPILDELSLRFEERVMHHPEYSQWIQGFQSAMISHVKQFIPEDSWYAFEQRWWMDVLRDEQRRELLAHPETKVIHVGMARFDNDVVWGWQHQNDALFHRVVYGEDPTTWIKQCMKYHDAPAYIIYMRPSHYHLASALATLGDNIILAQHDQPSDIDKACRQHLREFLKVSDPQFLPEKAFPKIIQPYEWEHPSYSWMSISANPHDYPGHVHVFTDASLQEDGRNGMAAVLQYNDQTHEFTKKFEFSDSIQGLEIEAAILGLENAHLLFDEPIALFSDNECVVMLLQSIQHHGYILGRWSDILPRERCKRLQPILAKTAVRWMKGHVHYPGNSRADELSKMVSLSTPITSFEMSITNT